MALARPAFKPELCVRQIDNRVQFIRGMLSIEAGFFISPYKRARTQYYYRASREEARCDVCLRIPMKYYIYIYTYIRCERRARLHSGRIFSFATHTNY